MTCKNCGNEIRDDAKFCPHCGAAGSGEAPVSPGYTPPEAPVPGQGRRGKGLIIGGIAAAVAVIALVAVFAGGLFSNPKGQVEKAAANSLAAWQAAEEAWNLPDLNEKWRQERNISQRVDLTLKSINSDLAGYDLSALSGLGLSVHTDFSAERKMSLGLLAHWKEDLLSLVVCADDSEMYFHSPQLTGETFYGVNTETLGADLAAMTGDSSVEDMGFNFFDLMDLAMDRVDPEELEQDWKEANLVLWEQAKVKKLGARTLDINGTETKTAAYQLTFPRDALYQYVDNLEVLLSAVNYYDLYDELLQAAGMPREEIQDFLDQLEELDVYGDLADSLRDLIDELGDVELEVCLSGGYVSALCYEGEVYGSDLELTLELGAGDGKGSAQPLPGGAGDSDMRLKQWGGTEYVDALTLTVKADSNSLELTSMGDHGGKSGTFTDRTDLRLREKGSARARVTSELSYDPARTEKNFQWSLEVSSTGLNLFSLETGGTLEAGEDYMDLALENVALKAMGMEICALGLECYTGCQPKLVDIENPRIITQMTQEELMAAALDIQARAEAWVAEMEELFLSRLPEELIWDLMLGS